LPTLSPILRQRVQLLSGSSNEPWLHLLCYDQDKAKKLAEVAKSDKFEPHPVSGEVEVDWDSDVVTTYKRVDEETLEAYVTLAQFALMVKLLFCTGDQEGGGDGWRVGEVSVTDSTDPQATPSIQAAERRFRESQLPPVTNGTPYYTAPSISNQRVEAPEEEDDDDAYWAQYDNTPARTPAPKASPAPPVVRNSTQTPANPDAEAAYYAQYAQVQPAMDSHDPDEAAAAAATHDDYPPPSHDEPSHQNDINSSRVWGDYSHAAAQQQHPPTPPPNTTSSFPSYTDAPTTTITELIQPRPKSSSSVSSGSARSSTVDKLESQAARLDRAHDESFGVKQHISTSIKSLFRLARAAGMERGEFEGVVRRELDVLAFMEEDD
jgi:hypothetical protein